MEGLDDVEAKAAFASGVASMAIGGDGSLWVWGRSKRGQLGLGEGITEATLPRRVEALAGEEIVKVCYSFLLCLYMLQFLHVELNWDKLDNVVEQVSLGWGHALAQSKDGKLFGWGYAAEGRLGGICLGGCSDEPCYEDGRTTRRVGDSGLSFDVAEKVVLQGIEKEKRMEICWLPSLVEDVYGQEVVDIACGLDHSLVLCR